MACRLLHKFRSSSICGVLCGRYICGALLSLNGYLQQEPIHLQKVVNHVDRVVLYRVVSFLRCYFWFSVLKFVTFLSISGRCRRLCVVLTFNNSSVRRDRQCYTLLLIFSMGFN